jgi:serine protease inhibitor
MNLKTTILSISAMLAFNSWGAEAINASNKIGVKLAAEKAKLSPTENFMVSPVSLHQALSLVANGTAGTTRQQLEKLFEAKLEDNNEKNANFVSGISYSPAQKKAVKYGKPAVVEIKNSIWTTNGKSGGGEFNFSESFKAEAVKNYAADGFSLDFKADQGAEGINNWANEKTYGMIPTIISKDELKDMVWVVMNATYIEANWAKPFRKLESLSPVFTAIDGSEKKNIMMGNTQRIAYSESDNGDQLGKIRFASADGSPALSFIAYLPAKGTDFAKAQADAFQASFWEESQEALDYKSIVLAEVVVPKFSFKTSVEMKVNSLTTIAMGLNFLFQNNANFSLMTSADNEPTKVGLIKQDSKIEFDEKGVKAAAVTLIGGMRSTSIGLPEFPTVKLQLDRPFIFSIVDEKTKAILFVGSVVNPK